MSEDGGVGTISSSLRGRTRRTGAFAGPGRLLDVRPDLAAGRVDAAFLAKRAADDAAFRGARALAVFLALLATACLVRATAFFAVLVLAALDATAGRRVVEERVDPVAFGRAGARRVVLDFFLEEAAFDELPALRLAMVESFRNLDSLAISVVLSDAYRKSDGAAEHLLTEIAGRRSPLHKRRHSYG